jgi:chemotaxis protein MotB
MAFFVMLFALSEIKSDRVRIIAAEISRAFKRTNVTGGATGLKTATSFARFRKTSRVTAVTGPDLRVRSFPQGQKIVIGGHVLFPKGSADLLPGAHRVLSEVADMVRGYKNRLEVRGHASRNEVGAGSVHRDEWELSFKRAQAVADFMLRQGGIPEARLRITGCSYHDPAVESLFESEDSRNRRVEIVEVAEFAP